MSLYERSSLERLTPEVRAPYEDFDPLDILEEQLPYDSFDDDSFVVGSASSLSAASAASTAPSDQPDQRDDLAPSPSFDHLRHHLFIDDDDGIEDLENLVRRAEMDRLELDRLEAQLEEQNPYLAGRQDNSGSRRLLRNRQPLSAGFRPLPDNHLPLPGDPVDRPQAQEDAQDELVDVELYRRRERASRPPAEVIDLTEEPDSPVQRSLSRSASFNPRRQHLFGRANPPSLSRSDSSILGGANRSQVVIDLTEDDAPSDRSRPAPRLPESPELLFVDQRPRLPPIPPMPQGRPTRHHHHHRRLVALPGLEVLRRGMAGDINLFDLLNPMLDNPGVGQGGHFNPAGPFNPVGPIDLQYEHHPFNRPQSSPKPVQEVPSPVRPGFTRDTDPETAFVCPGCNEELAYDPDDAHASEAQPTRASKSNKRSRSEHHFWAVKSCGHVCHLIPVSILVSLD